MIYNILKDKSEFMEKTMMDKKTQKKGLKIQYNTKKSVIYLIIAIPTIRTVLLLLRNQKA